MVAHCICQLKVLSGAIPQANSRDAVEPFESDVFDQKYSGAWQSLVFGNYFNQCNQWSFLIRPFKILELFKCPCSPAAGGDWLRTSTGNVRIISWALVKLALELYEIYSCFVPIIFIMGTLGIQNNSQFVSLWHSRLWSVTMSSLFEPKRLQLLALEYNQSDNQGLILFPKVLIY